MHWRCCRQEEDEARHVGIRDDEAASDQVSSASKPRVIRVRAGHGAGWSTRDSAHSFHSDVFLKQD